MLQNAIKAASDKLKEMDVKISIKDGKNDAKSKSSAALFKSQRGTAEAAFKAAMVTGAPAKTLRGPFLKIVESSLYFAFKQTYVYGVGDVGDEMAIKFAKAAANPIAKAVYNYLKCIRIGGSAIPIAPGLVCAAGPVQGVLNIVAPTPALKVR